MTDVSSLARAGEAVPTEEERKTFRESLRGLKDSEIADRRNKREYGNFDPNDSRNSSWRVIEANREIAERQRLRQLRPQWIAVWIAIAALIVAVIALFK